MTHNPVYTHQDRLMRSQFGGVYTTSDTPTAEEVKAYGLTAKHKAWKDAEAAARAAFKARVSAALASRDLDESRTATTAAKDDARAALHSAEYEESRTQRAAFDALVAFDRAYYEKTRGADGRESRAAAAVAAHEETRRLFDEFVAAFARREDLYQRLGRPAAHRHYAGGVAGETGAVRQAREVLDSAVAEFPVEILGEIAQGREPEAARFTSTQQHDAAVVAESAARFRNGGRR